MEEDTAGRRSEQVNTIVAQYLVAVTGDLNQDFLQHMWIQIVDSNKELDGHFLLLLRCDFYCDLVYGVFLLGWHLNSFEYSHPSNLSWSPRCFIELQSRYLITR